MKCSKAKEQLIALITLSSIFIFFTYLKLNPEISHDTSDNSVLGIDQIIDENIRYNNIEDELNDIHDNQEVKIADQLQLNNGFSQKELLRAKKYLDRDWRPDDTINQTAWNYVIQNPNMHIVESGSNSDTNQVVNNNIK